MFQRKQISDAVYLPIKTEAELVTILAQGDFDVVPFEDPLVSDTLRWQLYICHRNGALVTVSFAYLLDDSQLPQICVSTCREVLRAWVWPRDRRLVHDVIAFLLSKGARRGFWKT